MKTIALVAAVAVAAVTVSAASTPAFAQASGRFGAAKVSYQPATGRYCLAERVSGSLIPVKQCRTKAHWADAGLTISHRSTVQLAQR